MSDTPQEEKNEKMNDDSGVSSSVQDKLRYQAVLANIGDGLVVSGQGGKVIAFNKAAGAMLGWTESEALGKPLHEIIDINYKHGPESSTPGEQTRLYFARKDKSTFPAAIKVTSYVLGDKVLGTITLFRDITEELNVEMIKNEFISLASHQLRTPLSAIKWYTDMLIKGDAGKLTEEQTQYVQSVFTSTQRMIDLVNALLNISRLESGRVSIAPEITNIVELAKEVKQEVEIRFANKKHTITIQAPTDLPQINLDPRLIRQVFMNLLTNAAKYTPDNGAITITISQKDANILSEVKDNGYGIPKDEQNRIFDKFYRGTNIVSKVSDGTGLGLYLIKAIIELSQGKIWCESEEGKGTTFFFSLPISGTPEKKGTVTLES